MNLTEREIMNHPDLMVNVFDFEHRVLYWNKRCEAFFGIPETQALGKRFEDLVPQARNHPNMIYLDKALAGETNIVELTPYQRKEGAYTQIFFPLTNYKNEVAAVSIARDITQSKEKNLFFLNSDNIRTMKPVRFDNTKTTLNLRP
jgi:PAS domain S-box-containing protein